MVSWALFANRGGPPEYLAFGGQHEPRQNAQEAGFTGAIFPLQVEPLACIQLQIQRLKEGLVTTNATQLTANKHGCCHVRWRISGKSYKNS